MWFEILKDTDTCINWPDCNSKPEFYDKRTCLKYCRECKDNIQKKKWPESYINADTNTVYDWSPLDATYWKHCRKYIR